MTKLNLCWIGAQGPSDHKFLKELPVTLHRKPVLFDQNWPAVSVLLATEAKHSFSCLTNKLQIISKIVHFVGYQMSYRSSILLRCDCRVITIQRMLGYFCLTLYIGRWIKYISCCQTFYKNQSRFWDFLPKWKDYFCLQNSESHLYERST